MVHKTFDEVIHSKVSKWENKILTSLPIGLKQPLMAL